MRSNKQYVVFPKRELLNAWSNRTQTYANLSTRIEIRAESDPASARGDDSNLWRNIWVAVGYHNVKGEHTTLQKRPKNSRFNPAY
jgi:hypothetical protein